MKLGTIDIEKIYVGDNEIEKGYVGSSEVYEENSGPDYTIPFYVEDVSGSDNLIMVGRENTSAPEITFEKSTDGVNWSTWGKDTATITFKISPNSRLYIRANTEYLNWYTNYTTIKASQNFKVGGNVMSLLYGSSFTGNETSMRYQGAGIAGLGGLFYESKKLVSAKDLLLPATSLTTSVYFNMFSGCSQLITPPALPATTLATTSYSGMFKNCTSLTTAPELPATTLTEGCYKEMFYGCTSLTTAPELMATTLGNNCYDSMFKECTSLTYIKVSFTVWVSSTKSPTLSWTQLTRNTTGTFVCPAALPKYYNASGNNTYSSSTAYNATNAIPYGWTVQTF